MNIAVVHPYAVHARGVGGVTRLYELVRFLAPRHRVTVFTHAGDQPIPPDLELARLGVGQHAYPRPPANTRRKLGWCFDSAPYYVNHNVNPPMIAALAEADRRDPFDVVHMELGYMAPNISGIGSRAIRVLAEQEAMPLVIDRLRRLPWSERTGYERFASYTRTKVERFDRATLPRFDLIYAITPGEQVYLQRAAGRPVKILPHIVSLSRLAPSSPQGQCPNRVLFVGNFAHRPNVHATRWFVDRVWPLVRASVHEAEFHVVGPSLPPSLRDRLAGVGAVSDGYQPDLAACYRGAAVVVNPVRSGGGMRGKVLEALASACALVSTTIGLEGIAAVPEMHCLVGDTDATMADAVVRYLRNPDLRAVHGRAGRQLVGTLYDASVVFGGLEGDLDAACRARDTAGSSRIA